MKGVRVVGSARADLADRVRRRYEAGESIRSLAADLGRSYGFVQGLLKEQGVALRSRGGATRGPAAAARRAAVQRTVDRVRADTEEGAPSPE